MSKEPTIKIAFIDDHDLLRKGICDFLIGYGFEVLFEAENGKSAIDKIALCEYVPDLCIVDVNMPVMNGFETTKKLLEIYPQLKILAFSVNDDEKDVIKMLECGANGYVLKGADPDELKKAVETLFNGGQYFSAGIVEIAQDYYKN
ncbi:MULTISPECIES: response regulator transcription factor [Bacteroidota]|uniref:Response regulator protein vraR n=1 Tax=Chryseobacterium taklimakanense TaxID=536441 RepID=A0A239XUL3_9FLAO|nr:MULTISPECIES: response regulator transcription factor [Bacteroidota]PLK43922.1 DNA-binding response regulator [Emticicia sp. TH156]SNV49714.1 Response regulator protein vraR [Chryseobacterium taklimakanense]